MNRIACTMAESGYEVMLVGRVLADSVPLSQKTFGQMRLPCYFGSGPLLYVEFNIRLLFFLLFQKADIFCAIDLDTILPVLMVSWLKRKKRVYDAHELFTELQELISRPFIRNIWLRIERFAVPKFTSGYTVNRFIADEFNRRYGLEYDVIRNLPHYTESKNALNEQREKWIIYQGAVNEGRCFETLVPAMQWVDARLLVYGTGNHLEKLKNHISQLGLNHKVILKGNVLPRELATITPDACMGLTLFDSKGLNQYYSLSNRFFDYIMAGIPQICVNYPEYAAINQEWQVALLVDGTDPQSLSVAMNKLLSDGVLQEALRANCKLAKQMLNWENEKNKLTEFYKKL